MLTIAAWTLIPFAGFSCLPTYHRKNPHKFMGDANLDYFHHGLRAGKVSVLLN